jgi:hypothetical protein
MNDDVNRKSKIILAAMAAQVIQAATVNEGYQRISLEELTLVVRAIAKHVTQWDLGERGPDEIVEELTAFTRGVMSSVLTQPTNPVLAN